MQTHSKLSTRILSFVLAVAMVTTMMPAMAFAVEGGSAAPGTSPAGTIQAFETLEGRFIPSTGENAPSHVYGLSVALNTPYEDLKLPGQLTAKVARTAAAPAESKPAASSEAASVSAPASSSDAASGSASAASSEATEAGKEEIPAVAAPLAPEAKPTETAAVTTVQQETIPVTWHSDKAYQSDANGKFVYTAVLPEGYILADGVQLPQIHVAVGKQARAAGDAISVTINGSTVGGGATLQAVVEANGGATSVTSLKITAGAVTTADWNYLKNVTAMTSFEIANDPAVTVVADIPNGTSSVSIFPRSIVSVTVPQAIIIGDSAFSFCGALVSASFPAATSIGDSAFSICKALTSVSFPVATSIGEFAFQNCTELASISFPAATNIGKRAFFNDKKLVTLKLGATPPSVGTDAFKSCPATRALGYVDADGNDLTGTALAAAIAAYKAAAAPSDKWNGWTIESAPAAITVTINGTEYKGNTLQDAISKVPGGATAVISLNITAGTVTTADWDYLQNLYAMTSFEIANAPAVTAVADIPNGRSGSSIFPTSIEAVTVPQAVVIGNWAFVFCEALESVSFPAATSIGSYAFSSCEALTPVNFPMVTSIGNYAFEYCTALESANFPVATSIGEGAFRSGSALAAVNFPMVTSIGGYAFDSCVALANASFPALTSIDLGGFYNCAALTTLKLGATPPTNVASDAFDDCPATRALGYVDADGNNLTGSALAAAIAAYKAAAAPSDKWNGWEIEASAAITVTINGTTVGGGATLQAVVEANGGATAVTSLKITAGAVTTADWNYLASLTAMTSFEIANAPAVTAVADIPNLTGSGSIFPTSIETVTVPQAITIGNYAFNSCTALTSASFPLVTSIGERAFKECAVLASASFPVATSIGINAFLYCDALVSANFPVATSIGANAFTGCDVLTNVSFPALTDIGSEAFSWCIGLTTLKLGATPPTNVASDAFHDCPETRALGYVDADGNDLTGDALAAAVAAYKAAAGTDGKWYGWAVAAVPGAITVTINGTEYNGKTLQDAIGKVPGGDAAVISLNITEGAVTTDDWNYLKNLSAMTTFEIANDPAVTAVADIPNGTSSTSIFPTSIVSVTVPQAIAIGDHAFDYCPALTSVNFPAATSMGEYAFNVCNSLVSVSFPAVTSIGNSAFQSCEALTTVSFPAATSIGKSVFQSCAKLATLRLGATPPATVGDDAFLYCPATRDLVLVEANGKALKGPAWVAAAAAYTAQIDENGKWNGWTIPDAPPAITVTINGTAYDGKTLQDAIGKVPGGAAAVTSLNITEGAVTTDDWNYLTNLTAMTSFEIANDPAVTAVADIPNGDGSVPILPKSIVSVTVPQAITIGIGAFVRCKKLANASFPAATSIGESAFNDCDALTSASFPAATSIGESAFVSCGALANASFPLVTSIGNYAFNDCDVLVSASFPVATSIGHDAFYGCTALESVSIPAATSIGDNAFTYCFALTSANFPAVTSIGEAAFEGCTNLATLKLGATPPTLGADAFNGCPATRDLVLVDANGKVLMGAAWLFAAVAYKQQAAENGKWNGWTIPDAPPAIIITINDTAYDGKTLQEAIGKVPGGAAAVTSLNITDGEVTTADWNYLKNLTAMTTFEIAKAPAVKAVANIPNGASSAPIFPTSIVSVTVPQVIAIGDCAFYNRAALTTVNIPAATSIGDSAFAFCPALASVSFPAATSIGDDAFPVCTALASASFPAATSIGARAFYGCDALANASFRRATSIGKYAFENCTALATLTLGATPPTLGADAFKNCPEPRTLVLVDTRGNALTGSALTAAIANYKTAAGGADKWSGWTLPVAPTPTPPVSSSGSAANGPYYTIVATAGPGGSLSTGQNVQVPEGDSAGFAITPNKGYRIADVVVNGKSVGAKNYYVFTNVRSNQTIHVTFTQGGHTNPKTGVK